MPTTSPAVELILARLCESGDSPAMARTVGSVSARADTVLQDYGLAIHQSTLRSAARKR